MKNFLMTLCALLLLCTTAQATTLLYDNFNLEQFGTNNVSLDNWTVTNGTIDVIGSGLTGYNASWEWFGGANGYYLDLDGSNQNAGRLESNMLFGPGTYTITYDLAGSRREASPINTLDIYFGGFSEIVTMGSQDGWDTYVRNVTLTSAANLIFDHRGGDNIGLLLDNVMVETAPVPEPATILLMGLGLFGIVGIRRRKKS